MQAGKRRRLCRRRLSGGLEVVGGAAGHVGLPARNVAPLVAVVDTHTGWCISLECRLGLPAQVMGIIRFAGVLMRLMGMLLVFTSCDISQKQIDEATERIGEQTVAVGDRPTEQEVNDGVPLQRSHIAGSSWRFIVWDAWPEAAAIASFASNGRVTWPVGGLPAGNWSVDDGELQFMFSVCSGSGCPLRGRFVGTRTSQHEVCLVWLEEEAPVPGSCHYVLQRITGA